MSAIARTLAAALAATLVAALAGCGQTTAPDRVKLTVFAAASLRMPFTDIGRQFEAAHPGVTVAFNFAGSSDLVAQIQQGAAADVFASADTTNMAKATADGSVTGTPQDFASNTLAIATPPGNPAGIASFADLARPGVKVVLCAPQVPCGAATRKIESATGVAIAPVSEESSVTDVLNKVTTGEADAGLVYVTDVKAAGDRVMGVPFAESARAVNVYPIGVVKAGAPRELATRFVAFVLGATGQHVLAAAGFAKPRH